MSFVRRMCDTAQRKLTSLQQPNHGGAHLGGCVPRLWMMPGEELGSGLEALVEAKP